MLKRCYKHVSLLAYSKNVGLIVVLDVNLIEGLFEDVLPTECHLQVSVRRFCLPAGGSCIRRQIMGAL